MKPRVVVVGGGPAGLMAAEAASARGAEVVVVERKRSVGRKFLVAGKGGLNLTHSEPLDSFLRKYGGASPHLEPFVRAFPPDALRAFADALGQTTWIGSSGRVFPKDAKAAPLLRAWVARLRRGGVEFRSRLRWAGFGEQREPVFLREDGAEERLPAHATVLALGGASWPETGSDGAWVDVLRGAGIGVAALAPANAGWVATLAPGVAEKLAGEPLKSIALSVGTERARGDVVVTKDGLEGTPVYRLGPALRAALANASPAIVLLDLKPDSEPAALTHALSRSASKSLSTRLRGIRLDGAARTLALATLGAVREPSELARRLKALPLEVTGFRPIAEAISSAGGVRWDEIDERLMLRTAPGIFVAGEMLDWEAPTGGYLLQACFSTGRAAGDFASRFAEQSLAKRSFDVSSTE